MNESRITAAEFEGLLRASIADYDAYPCTVLSLGWGEATLRLGHHASQLRAGGTLNGPTMFTLADTGLYAAVLTRIGMQPLAVTSELGIRFLRKPAPRPLVAHAKLLRVGKRSAVGTVEIATEGDPELVAHATGTYALP